MKKLITAVLLAAAALAPAPAPAAAVQEYPQQNQPCSVTWLSTWRMRGVCTHGGSYHFQITCKLGSTYKTYSTTGYAPNSRTLNCSSSSWIILGYGIWT